jgi:hypothetical protein
MATKRTNEKLQRLLQAVLSSHQQVAEELAVESAIRKGASTWPFTFEGFDYEVTAERLEDGLRVTTTEL